MAGKYRDMVLRGVPVTGLDVVDAHNHLGPYFNFPVHRGGSAESLIERAVTTGVGIMCVSANAAIGPDMRLGNDEAEAAVRAHPGRIYAYATIKPCPESEMEEELKRRFSAGGFIGIKLHPGLHGVRVADNSYRPAMEWADRQGLPVLIHTWSRADVADMEKLAAAFPNARFIIAHMGGDPAALEDALDVMVRRDNVFGDTALSYAPHRNIEYAVSRAGAEKVIFGSDAPFYDPVFTLARVVCADIKESEIEKIAGGNFRAICPALGKR